MARARRARIDLAPAHVDAAALVPGVTAQVGDALQLPVADGGNDAVSRGSTPALHPARRTRRFDGEGARRARNFTVTRCSRADVQAAQVGPSS